MITMIMIIMITLKMMMTRPAELAFLLSAGSLLLHLPLHLTLQQRRHQHHDNDLPVHLTMQQKYPYNPSPNHHCRSQIPLHLTLYHHYHDHHHCHVKDDPLTCSNLLYSALAAARSSTLTKMIYDADADNKRGEEEGEGQGRQPSCAPPPPQPSKCWRAPPRKPDHNYHTITTR